MTNMPFPFAERVIPTEKNGPVTLRWSFWYGRGAYAFGHQQSGDHLADMWRKSLWGVPEKHPAKQILLLGLGAGSVLPVLRKRYPNGHVTAVEWDPAMADLAKSTGSYRAKNAPEVVIGDACDVVPKFNRRFDLILVDLFTGGEAEPRLASPEMIAALSRALEPDGYLLLNVFRAVSLVPAFEKRFSRHGTYAFENDLVALFRHPGQGRIGDRPPEGFVHPMQSPDYLLGGWEPGAANVEMLGAPGCLGMRWHFGPFWVESYTTDVQPVIDRSAPTRLVIWQPITKLGKPAGWHRSWVQMNPQQHGFADILGKDEYWKDWTDHAQRHRKKWLKDDRFDIIEVPLDAFAAAYHKTGKLPMIRRDFINLLGRRIRRHGDRVHLFAARKADTGEIISGLGVVDVPDASFSMHLVAYIHPKFEGTSVGTGLIDHWYAHCRREGIRFPHFGLVWAPGDPGSWKGYSKFKRQFNLHLLRYPAPLIRFVRKKK
jgi:precorrin-6B methylase 2/GNAT superfamily N-acetyltransferase